jgi:polyhydroxybutyrate depolymerase
MVIIMTRFAFILGVFLMLLPSGGHALSAWQQKKQAVANASPMVDLDGRGYRLYVPSNLPDGQVPLLLALHGGYGNSEYFQNALKMDRIADKYGFIVAYPNGTEGKIWLMKNKRMWNSGHCCGIAAKESIDDVSFLANVIIDVKANYPIDPKRVYITGHSNGAMMSYRFVCERPDMVAAMVGISGQLTADRCKSARNVEVLHIHGDSDVNVPSQGGSTSQSSKELEYRSVQQTEAALEQSGAMVTVKMLPQVDHSLASINSELQNENSRDLPQTIADFLLSKKKQ